MKKIVFLSLLSLLVLASCNKKAEKNIDANTLTVENFVNELKDIERPAAEEFNLFLGHLDSIGGIDATLPKEQLDSLFNEQLVAMNENRTVLTEASLQFQAQGVSIKAMPLDDTLAILLASATTNFDKAYQARAGAVGNVLQYYSTSDQRFLEGYQLSLKLAKEFSDKAFFWVTMARQYASGLKSPLLPSDTTSTNQDTSTAAPAESAPKQ